MLDLHPFQKGAAGVVRIPGSKSITNRALLLAALSSGESTIRGGLESDDALVMQEALRELGIKIEKQKDIWTVHGRGGEFTSGNYDIYLGNAGTAMRFLTAAIGLVSGNIRLYGKKRMHDRPIHPLVHALSQLGLDIDSQHHNGCPPILSKGNGYIRGGECSISGETSSQFLSALLLIAATTQEGIHMTIIPPLVSKPYLEMTCSLLEQYGIQTKHISEYEYSIQPQIVQPIHLDVEADASSAAHVFSLAIAATGTITISNFPEKSIQGDAGFLKILERFGATVSTDMTGVTVTMNQSLQPLGEVDFEDMPDVSLAAVTLCALAPGVSRLTGLSTLKKKECDRIEALRINLERMGASLTTGEDFIEINGNPDRLHGAEIETFDDHRIAMSFAALGTTVPGVHIVDPGCVAKTFPNFWEIFEAVRA